MEHLEPDEEYLLSPAVGKQSISKSHFLESSSSMPLQQRYSSSFTRKQTDAVPDTRMNWNYRFGFPPTYLKRATSILLSLSTKTKIGGRLTRLQVSWRSTHTPSSELGIPFSESYKNKLAFISGAIRWVWQRRRTFILVLKCPTWSKNGFRRP